MLKVFNFDSEQGVLLFSHRTAANAEGFEFLWHVVEHAPNDVRTYLDGELIISQTGEYTVDNLGNIYARKGV